MKYLTLTLFGVLLFSNTISAWEPDPGCRAINYPIPSVRSCSKLVDKYLIAQRKYQDEADKLAKWGGFLEDLEKELTDKMIGRSIDALNPIPTDATSIAGCFLEVCKKGFEKALMFGSLAFGHSQDVATGFQAGNAYRAHARRVEALRVILDAAGAALEECEAGRAIDLADAERVLERNKNAKPRYSYDHDKCNPPKDESPIGENKKLGEAQDDKSNQEDDRGH